MGGEAHLARAEADDAGAAAGGDGKGIPGRPGGRGRAAGLGLLLGARFEALAGGIPRPGPAAPARAAALRRAQGRARDPERPPAGRAGGLARLRPARVRMETQPMAGSRGGAHGTGGLPSRGRSRRRRSTSASGMSQSRPALTPRIYGGPFASHQRTRRSETPRADAASLTVIYPSTRRVYGPSPPAATSTSTTLAKYRRYRLQ